MGSRLSDAFNSTTSRASTTRSSRAWPTEARLYCSAMGTCQRNEIPRRASFHRQGLLVHRFEEARPQDAMHLEGCVDDDAGNLVEFRIWFGQFGVCGVLAVHPDYTPAHGRSPAVVLALLPGVRRGSHPGGSKGVPERANRQGAGDARAQGVRITRLIPCRRNRTLKVDEQPEWPPRRLQ